MRKHGLSYTKEYRAWQTMRLRCLNPENKAYPDYGGRGIKVCERWKDDPAAFLEDMGQKPSPRHELDRIDNDGHYEPGNCRWVLRPTNSRNRRSNRYLSFCGETKTLAEWCEQLGVSGDVVQKRLSAGWSVDRALTAPVRPKAKNGETLKPVKVCADCGKSGIVGEKRCQPCENRARPSRSGDKEAA